jgi:hypothetical protein
MTYVPAGTGPGSVGLVIGPPGSGTYEAGQTLPAITAISWSAGVITVTLGTGHYVVAGQAVMLSGFKPCGYNGVFTVTSVTSTTLLINSSVNPGSGTHFGIGVSASDMGFQAALSAAQTYGEAYGFSLPILVSQDLLLTQSIALFNGLCIKSASSQWGSSGISGELSRR